jgi:hypothetical protein
MGIKTSEGELLLLEQTPINIGNSKTTTGVLFPDFPEETTERNERAGPY